MQKHKRERPRKKREYAGESLAKPVIDFLNHGGKEAERLSQLLDAARRLRDATEPVTGEMEARWMRLLEMPAEDERIARTFPTMDRQKPRQAKEAQLAQRAVNEVLVEVSLVPQVIGSYRQRWLVEWRGSSGSFESRAFYCVVRLGELGLLHHLRRCQKESCGQWFFAGAPHKLFHSKKCQAETYEAKPGRKAARAEWARDYYQNQRRK